MGLFINPFLNRVILGMIRRVVPRSTVIGVEPFWGVRGIYGCRWTRKRPLSSTCVRCLKRMREILGRTGRCRIVTFWCRDKALGGRRPLLRNRSFEAGDGLGAGADVEFLVDAFDVGSDGGVCHVKAVCNLLVKKAFREKSKDFLFAW